MSIPFKIDRFDLGMTNNIRDTFGMSPITKNFDTISKKNALIPYRQSETGDDTASTRQITQMVQYDDVSGNTYVYGLGKDPSNEYVKIFKKSDFTDATWSAPANGASASGNREQNVLVEYHGFLYGLRAGTSVWKADVAAASAFTEADAAITYTSAAQGLVHSRDDILYIPYYDSATGNAAIAKNNSGAWTATALQLPKFKIPIGLCEDGNYLGCGARPASGIGRSTYYLWDRDSSLTTLSDKIDFGYGSLQVIEKIDGVTFGVSVVGDSTNGSKYRMIVRYWDGSGSEAQFMAQFDFDGVPTVYGKQKVDKKILFSVIGTINGEVMDGLWAISKNKNGTYAVTFDRLVNNDTGLTSSKFIKGFFQLGDIVFISYQSSGTFGMSKTDDQATYNSTSIYETTVFDAGDKRNRKDLIGITVTTEPLPTNGSYTIKYKADADSSWTTIFTESTDNSISHSAINIESTGAQLPSGKELRFRIESTGGAVITSLYGEVGVAKDDLY
jgi:hypothetical protein